MLSTVIFDIMRDNYKFKRNKVWGLVNGMSKYTPMIEQYLSIKEQAKDAFLFFRLGDFYEMFFDDAILASKELEITLTGREGGATEKFRCAACLIIQRKITYSASLRKVIKWPSVSKWRKPQLRRGWCGGILSAL